MKTAKGERLVYEFEAFPVIEDKKGPSTSFGIWSTFSFNSLKKAKAERDRIIKARRLAGRAVFDIPIYRVVRTLVKEAS
jgi:hypothetical protein